MTNPAQRLAGKVAVVSGAAVGLGQAFAERLARDGADVLLVDLNEASETAARIEALGRRAVSVRCDVSDPTAVEAMAQQCRSAFGRCDILVNNAGIYFMAPFETLSFADWKRLLATNLDSTFLLSKAFAPGMKERGWGRIINLATNSIGLIAAGMTHYVTSKAAIVGFTRALATELGEHGVTVNAVAPGPTRTHGTTTGLPPGVSFDEVFSALAQQQAIKRGAEPSDIVGAVSFLASDDAAFMTGQTLVVDGGWWRV
ncbi:MAG: 3-oxoacyl-ACP reductase FabG [Hyphomonadaceae bacterium]|nr:3-oxoacyl-ACP reductase FabG [Hyphomonadaceae bacterium]